MRLIRSNKYIRRLTAGLSACLISASLMHVDAYALNNIDNSNTSYEISDTNYLNSKSTLLINLIHGNMNGDEVLDVIVKSGNNYSKVISTCIKNNYIDKEEFLNTYLPYMILTKEIDFSDMGNIGYELIKSGDISFNDLSLVVSNVSRYYENEVLSNILGDKKFLYKFNLEDVSKMVIPISKVMNLSYDDFNNFFISLNPYYYDYDLSMYSDKRDDHFYVTIGNKRYSVTDNDRELIKNHVYYYKWYEDTGVEDYERALDNFIVYDMVCGMVSSECGAVKTYDEALAVVSVMVNRLDSSRWQHHNNGDLVAKLSDHGQYEVYMFTPDREVGFSQYIDNNAPNAIRKAVTDCLYHGVRNNYFCEFRANAMADRNQIYFISDGGNMYFDLIDGLVTRDDDIIDPNNNRFVYPNSAQCLDTFRK